MGIGDPTLPVDDSTPANNPVPRSGDDTTKSLEERVSTLERSGNAELAAAVRWLFENATGGPYPYPPP